MYKLFFYLFLGTSFDVVHSKYMYHPASHRKIAQYKAIATWEEAKQRCESEGARLASPLNAELLQYMRSIITVNNHTTPYFIGFKAKQNMAFSSEEGVLLEDVPEAFDMVQQMDLLHGDCLCMDGHSIRVESCLSRLPFICYTDVMTMDALSEIPTITHKRESRQCGPDYKQYPTGCYKLHEAKMNWTNAYWKCDMEGAHLVVINDSDEAKVVADILKDRHIYWTWAGLRKVEGRSNWVSITGDRIEELYHDWFDDYHDDNSCGLLIDTGKVNDWGCDATFAVICEKYVDNCKKIVH